MDSGQIQGNLLKNIQFAGDTDGNNDFDVSDPTSYVSYTYNKVIDEKPALFYDQSKKMFYLTFKLKEYVISYHFPEASSWNQKMYVDYTEDIIDGIMNAHANGLVFEFVNSIIRGLQK